MFFSNWYQNRQGFWTIGQRDIALLAGLLRPNRIFDMQAIVGSAYVAENRRILFDEPFNIE